MLGGDGLADAPHAYEFHVKATKSGSPHNDSAYSDTVIIVDTPITAANGNSPGSQGQAKLSWRTMANVLGDASYFGGAYSFRFRRADGNHAQLTWKPGKYASDEIVDQAHMTGANNDTIGGLTKEKIYAIQLRYEKTGTTGTTTKVYAARDAYVWPSDRPAGGGERVGTFPLNYPLSNKTFSYVVCEETFPSGREADWKKFISHAFSQWDLATNGLVTTEREDGECADFSGFVDEIRNAVISFATNPSLPGPPPSESQIEAHARSLLSKFDKTGMKIKDARKLDAALNEVLMIDDDPSDILVRVQVFQEVSTQVGYGWCRGACTSFPKSPLNTVDIRFLGSKFQISNLNVPGPDDTASPGEVPFNSCGSTDTSYGRVMHEAGHALGIAGVMTQTNDQGQYHPHIEDSVMSYGLRDQTVSCSPHPFDVMALYALYQSR